MSSCQSCLHLPARTSSVMASPCHLPLKGKALGRCVVKRLLLEEKALGRRGLSGLSLRGAKRRGLRATAASGGGKGAKKLGRHLPWRERSEAGRLSVNPEISGKQVFEPSEIYSIQLPGDCHDLLCKSRNDRIKGAGTCNHPEIFFPNLEDSYGNR